MSDADDFMTRYSQQHHQPVRILPIQAGIRAGRARNNQVTCRDRRRADGRHLPPGHSGRTRPSWCVAPTRSRSSCGSCTANISIGAATRWCANGAAAPTPRRHVGTERQRAQTTVPTCFAWCEHQDWIDVIGLWGTSYLSLTCWTVADITTPRWPPSAPTTTAPTGFASAYQRAPSAATCSPPGPCRRRISGRRRLHEIRLHLRR